MKKIVHEPYNKLKGFLYEKGITYDNVAHLIGVTASTVSMKINGYSDFYLSEQRLIKKEYGVDENFFA